MSANPDSILDRLDRVRPTGPQQYEACCPAHNDTVQSLAVGLNGRGDIMLHCHAGCATGDVVAALEVQWGALFVDGGNGKDGPVRLRDRLPTQVPTNGNGNGLSSRRRDDTVREPKGTLPPRAVIDHWASQRHLVTGRLLELRGWSERALQRFEVGCDGERATWPVYDAHGHLVNVCRYRPGGKPKMRALPGRPRELFPAPEAVEGEVLWLVEGEPDSVSMFELGIPATGVPGVGTWQAGWAERFHGRRVVVCFDCDRQGREAAQKRAAVLIANGVQAWTTDLDPGRECGYDLTDALLDAIRERRRPDLLAFLGRLQAEALS